jgi:hypothetical protein
LHSNRGIQLVDFGSFAAVMSSLKTASDMAQAMIALRDGQALQIQVIELNNQIITAQAAAMAAHDAHAAAVQRIRELEAENANLKDWNREEQRYHLTKHGGALTYSVKPGMENGEPLHRLCPRCYQQRKKSLLQPHGRTPSGQEKVSCLSCKAELLLGEARTSPPPRERW